MLFSLESLVNLVFRVALCLQEAVTALFQECLSLELKDDGN